MDNQDEILARLERIEAKVDHIVEELEGHRGQNPAALLDQRGCASMALEHQVDHIGNECRFASRTPPR
jgi:hypothetical protein